MSEQAMWRGLRDGLKRELGRDARTERIENRAGRGTPDVVWSLWGVGGLTELKHAPRWPAGEDTPLALDHFTQEQRIFQRHWWRGGGNVSLLLKVDPGDWLLFDGMTAFELVGRGNKSQLIEAAVCYTQGLDIRTIAEAMANIRERGK